MRKNYPVKYEKQYDLIRLPAKYHKFYIYGTQVCDVIRSKSVKVRLEDKDGKYYLLHGKNFPNFEAKFKDGNKLTHTLSSEYARLELIDGNVYEINIHEDVAHLDPKTKFYVDKAFEKMNECLRVDQEREQL
jgi:hypothetical protein